MKSLGESVNVLGRKRIVHLCLACFYIDDHLYQENALVRQHRLDGHDVTVIASTETFGADKALAYVEPSEYLGSDGAPVVRLPYRWFPRFIGAKVRSYRGLMQELERVAPDIVVCHGISGAWLKDVVRYKERNSSVRVFADNHADLNNSATSFLSMKLLHRVFYRALINRARHIFEKILCASTEAMDFAHSVYDIPSKDLEFFPLGGVVFNDDDYRMRRDGGRADIGLADDDVMLLQSGKFDSKKKLIESALAFSRSTTSDKFHFVVAGHLSDEVDARFRQAMETDPRIKFVGWKSPEDLMTLLCAADLYVQPGSQSATMQMSLSARCPVILADVKAHHSYMDKNGWLVKNDSDLGCAMAAIQRDPSILKEMACRSHDVAMRLLDYRVLAARFY